MYYDLPTALEVGDESWAIRSDFRVILSILGAFDDPDLKDTEKAYVCLYDLYEDFEALPKELYGEAFEAAVQFIDHNTGAGKGARTMDWEQDANLLFPAINHVAGREVRAMEYLHWWTFLGFFMEMGEGVYSTVLSLRSKRSRKKKLEKWEEEWWRNNAEICKLKKRYSQEELERQKKIIEMLGG